MTKKTKITITRAAVMLVMSVFTFRATGTEALVWCILSLLFYLICRVEDIDQRIKEPKT